MIHEKEKSNTKNLNLGYRLKAKTKGEETQGTGHKRKGLLHQ